MARRGLAGLENASPVRPLSEKQVLELEREALLRLCGEPMSRELMAHMLRSS